MGYLLGLVHGPVVAVVGGLALITFGRNLLLEHHAAALSGAALAVMAAALGIAALRWGALDLDELRGVQAVLGPTLLVGPVQAAWATSIAAVAGFAGLVVWTARPWPSTRALFAWWSLEAALGSLALISLFFEPAGIFERSNEGVSGLLGAFGAPILLTAAVAGAGRLLRAVPEVVPVVLMLGSGAALAGSAAVLATAL